ncbi:UNVERIFIED_CONTAM: hypothetical protein HDU68_012055 [Siphonaria sp. JEL0065]|nr:hypothetical protein HDU68_012055 [Siphonaria sp. JEL0065]
MPISNSSLLLASTPTLLSTIAEKDGRSQQEKLAKLRLENARSLLTESKHEALHQLLLSLDYVPSSLLSLLANFSPDATSHRLSQTIHTLIPLLACHIISLEESKSIHKISPESIPIHPRPSVDSDAVSVTEAIPAFHFLDSNQVMRLVNEFKVFANLGRVLGIFATGIVAESGDGKVGGGSVELWRMVDVYQEGLDLHWMVVLGTWHLYTGQIRVWLRRIFNRMQERAVAKTGFPNQTSTPVKQATASSRRLTPTIMDVQTFLLSLIARNYIECIQTGGAKTIAEVLWLSLGKQFWVPSAKMMSFWKALLVGYSDLEGPNSTVKPMDAVEVTKYLRDIRALSGSTGVSVIPSSVHGVIAHVGILYARLALVGAENCRTLAVSVLEAIVASSANEKVVPSVNGFFQDLANGFGDGLVQQWESPLIEACQIYLETLSTNIPVPSPNRIPTPSLQYPSLSPPRNPFTFSSRSRTPSPTRQKPASLFSPVKQLSSSTKPKINTVTASNATATPQSATSATSPTRRRRKSGTPTSKPLYRDDSFDRVVADVGEFPTTATAASPLSKNPDFYDQETTTAPPPTTPLSETITNGHVTRNEKKQLERIFSGSNVKLDVPPVSAVDVAKSGKKSRNGLEELRILRVAPFRGRAVTVGGALEEERGRSGFGGLMDVPLPTRNEWKERRSGDNERGLLIGRGTGFDGGDGEEDSWVAFEKDFENFGGIVCYAGGDGVGGEVVEEGETEEDVWAREVTGVDRKVRLLSKIQH